MKVLNTVKLDDGRRVICRIFDNGGATFDRFTAALKGYRDNCGRLYYPYLSSSENPFSPQGIGQYGESEQFLAGRHLGKRISFQSLPDNVQNFILQQFSK